MQTFEIFDAFESNRGESVGKHVPNWAQESFEDIRTITSRFVT